MAPRIFVTDLPADEQKICEGCSACVRVRGKKNFLEFCSLADLENNSLEVLNRNTVEQSSVDISNIPEGCPQGYGVRREIY